MNNRIMKTRRIVGLVKTMQKRPVKIILTIIIKILNFITPVFIVASLALEIDSSRPVSRFPQVVSHNLRMKLKIKNKELIYNVQEYSPRVRVGRDENKKEY